MKDEQASGQTVREILQNHSYVQRYALKLIPAADKQHMNGYEVAEAANDIRLNNQMETEAAINAHIVSVLEGLKGNLPDTTFHGSSIKVKDNIRDGGYIDGVVDSRLAIDAAIARYKQKGSE